MTNHAERPERATDQDRSLVMMLAVVIIISYLVFIALAYTRADDSGPDLWNHIVKLLEVVSPIVGVAVGWVFGKEVHRREAQTAEQTARRFEHDAKSGHALAGAVRVRRGATTREPLRVNHCG